MRDRDKTEQTGAFGAGCEVLTDPKKLVRLELKNEGFDLDKINVPKRVYLLADRLYDEMILKNCATYQYPLGGELYVFDANENIGFVKGNMCSPAIATQAEDLIAGGVKELIHVGFAGGLQTDMQPGDFVITDGAYNDTAVARLYGYDLDIMESSKELTDQLCKGFSDHKIAHRRGVHWTTDAGYMETWGQVMEYREKGALCVEMEGVGLFTVAAYRRCFASAIYVISDVYTESNWDLGWGENQLEDSVQKVLDFFVNV
ncbi:MAG: nucleoside phosphorylase [Lachnospiraceae bacterium]|nr:nucleoside phosphorylase [Lachnospiraceae bacterium]